MKSMLFIILSMLTISVFPQETELLNIGKINTETTTRNSSNTFNLALEGNSDLNLCYGDLEGRIAWIPPGISGGVPYNGLEEINNAISNGNISSETPYVDPNSTGNYYLGPFIHLDNNNCDGEYDGTETLMENITSLAAGCYIVYVIDALGMQSEITSITISEPTEIMTLIPLINNTCNEETNGSIEIQALYEHQDRNQRATGQGPKAKTKTQTPKTKDQGPSAKSKDQVPIHGSLNHHKSPLKMLK